MKCFIFYALRAERQSKWRIFPSTEINVIPRAAQAFLLLRSIASGFVGAFTDFAALFLDFFQISVIESVGSAYI